jgi:hypothetical protein
VHFKKKWRVSRNGLFIMRQDVAEGNWASVPSPELQLEHEVRAKMQHHSSAVSA